MLPSNEFSIPISLKISFSKQSILWWFDAADYTSWILLSPLHTIQLTYFFQMSINYDVTCHLHLAHLSSPPSIFSFFLSEISFPLAPPICPMMIFYPISWCPLCLLSSPPLLLFFTFNCTLAPAQWSHHKHSLLLQTSHSYAVIGCFRLPILKK